MLKFQVYLSNDVNKYVSNHVFFKLNFLHQKTIFRSIIKFDSLRLETFVMKFISIMYGFFAKSSIELLLFRIAHLYRMLYHKIFLVTIHPIVLDQWIIIVLILHSYTIFFKSNVEPIFYRFIGVFE